MSTLRISAAMAEQDSTNNANKTWLQLGSYLLTRTTNLASAGTQNIGTSTEAIGIGDVTAPGWAALRNLDATNYVEIGFTVSATFYAAIRLNAGEACVVPLSGTPTWQARANTAAVDLEYAILQRNA